MFIVLLSTLEFMLHEGKGFSFIHGFISGTVIINPDMSVSLD